MPTGKIYLGETLISEGAYYPSEKWSRQADWLAMPNFSSSEGFVGLHAVWNDDANFVAFTAAGDFTVDWGDGGATENFSSGTTVYKNLSWANYNSLTETSKGYRQAIIKITPQSGQSITSINLAVKHNQSGLANNYSSGWLDLIVNGANLTSLTIGSTTDNVRHRLLEKVTILNLGSITNLSNLFANCSKLQSVPLFTTTSVTNMSQMFFGCYAIDDIPLFDTASVTDMSGMFNGCLSLRKVPKFNTSAVTTVANMFEACRALQYVPLFDTSNVTVTSYWFADCTALKTIPLLDTSSATTMNHMFYRCSALQRVPLFDTSAATTIQGMFFNCYSLTEVPAFDTSNVTNMASVFSSCYSLQSVPLFDTSSVTSMSTMFGFCSKLKEIPAFDTSSVTAMGTFVQGCTALEKFPLLDTSAVTNAALMFTGCSALQSIPALDMSAATNLTGWIYSSATSLCQSLSKVSATGMNASFRIDNSKLSSTDLNEIYTNLSATGAGKTITVTGNYGTAGDNPSIATAKGWTVSG